MKKKLIAIVASLAMVATMVPATAFAADSSDAAVTIAKWNTAGGAGSLDEAYNALKTAGNEDNLTFTDAGSKLLVQGALPYNTLEKFSKTKSLQEGHYFGMNLTIANRSDGGITNKVMALSHEGTHTLSGDVGTVYTDDLTYFNATSGAVNDTIIQRLTDANKVKTYEFYAISALPTAASSAVAHDAVDKKTQWFGNLSTAQQNAAGTVYGGTTAQHDAILKDKTKSTVTLDASGVELLNKADTDALVNFVETVAEIGTDSAKITDTTDADLDSATEAQIRTYTRRVDTASQAYEALTDGQKKVIANTISQNKEHNYKRALEALEIAKKNIANIDLIEKVTKEIKDLPDLSKTTAFKDKAEIDAIFVPMTAAKKDFDALTTPQKTTVNTNTSPTMDEYKANYDRLIQAYVNPLYAKAAAIDLEKPLTDADVALIAELKAYVDGKYIATASIARFNQATYDALIAALDKVEKDAKSLANAEVTVAGADSIVYDGTKKTPELTVTIGGKEVPADAYDKIYSDNKDAGEAIVTIIPKDESGYTGKKEVTFTIKPAALTGAMVKSVANATYTGAAVTPAVTVDKGVTYEVTYKNNTAVGKATAVITGTGNYSGEITKNFIVKPAKEAISSLKAGKKSLTVAYNAQSGAKYRIVYSPAKGQAKAVNTTATKKTIKNLKAGKTYKVKVRAYKAIDGTTYNGTYSTVKKVKVK